MATQYLQKFDSVAFIQNLPAAAGIGVVGGQPYFNAGGGPIPLGIAGVTGTTRVVNPADTSGQSYETIQAAVDAASAGDRIYIAPGAYDETVTVAATKSKLTFVGMGGRGSVFIEPSTEDADGMYIHADDVTLINLGVAGEDETSAIALTVTGARFRSHGCKFEGGAEQLRIGPGTVAQESAGTHGTGADFLIRDCEFAWGTKGIVLNCTDYGAVTQGHIEGNRFHNLTASSIDERTGTGGSAAVGYRNITIKDNQFDDAEDGTAPTAYVLLNDDNGNTGVAAGNWFPTAINSGKNLVSTALHWVSNFHTGGVSTAQPS